jgi:dihydroceramidase
MVLWEPHTSSIDFCESNYLVSNHIVEYHNTWSSFIGILLFGIFGLLKNNHMDETRNVVSYLILVFTGAGSAGLHGTLHWFFQSADELPMVYLLLSFCFSCAEYDAPVGKPNYPQLPKLLGSLTLINTAIYYCFQKFFIVFVISFAAEVFAIFAWMVRIVYGYKSNKAGQEHKRSYASRRMCNLAWSSIAIGFFPCWVYDMLQCKSFIMKADESLFGITPHVIWHFGAGFSAYCTILCLECCRMEELNVEYDAKFIGGLLPFVSRKAGSVVAVKDSNSNIGQDGKKAMTRIDAVVKDRNDTINSLKHWLDEK